ncbi:MAG: lipocalin family protein [Gammaproteobacteria bacterium]
MPPVVNRQRKNSRQRASHSQYRTLLRGSAAFLAVGVWLIYRATHLEPSEQWFEAHASDAIKVSLPRDNAPHQSKIEWWYYNGHLTTESGRQFSFHHTVFLVNSVLSQVVSHVSFNDHQNGRHFTDQRRTGGNPSVGLENRYEFKQGDWLMAGGNGSDRLNIVTRDFSFDLELSATQPAVFHGDGIISLADAGSSYYYSRPRMTISGVITLKGISEHVTGIAWFDHQWGDFSVGQLAWDWFSLQLNDNIDAMVYQLRNKSNKPVLNMISFSQNGNTELLQADDFIITPGEKWTSDRTGVAYPIAWTIRIPKKNMDITARSKIKNCEFDARLTTYNVYWEGAVSIQGTHTGQGFMELSGYEADKSSF